MLKDSQERTNGQKLLKQLRDEYRTPQKRRPPSDLRAVSASKPSSTSQSPSTYRLASQS